MADDSGGVHNRQCPKHDRNVYHHYRKSFVIELGFVVCCGRSVVGSWFLVDACDNGAGYW